ncbi:cupin domain-containing protein [Leifsonia sp. Le1]|uniref:cupin domain-containing protein n=1 Tax=Leifsonia sp. Le1 TaxID=3404918 RepID=UPI003EB878DD
MNAPSIVDEPVLGVADALEKYAPEQGGIEYQRDQPGKVHSWHSHDLHERLIVLSGSMLLSWRTSEGEVVSQRAVAGTRIELPANTVHQSTADDVPCTYLIYPEGGRAAVTTHY